MNTVDLTPGQELLASSPAIQTHEVPDYSRVPPVGDYSPHVAPSSVSNSSLTGKESSPPKMQEWDYGQKGGADFNMEAPILEEDLVKAGGFGAKDELNSFLPAAVDDTDYEESLKEAMEYEDVQPARGEIARPGVGFVKSNQEQMDGYRDAPKD